MGKQSSEGYVQIIFACHRRSRLWTICQAFLNFPSLKLKIKNIWDISPNPWTFATYTLTTSKSWLSDLPWMDCFWTTFPLEKDSEQIGIPVDAVLSLSRFLFVLLFSFSPPYFNLKQPLSTHLLGAVIFSTWKYYRHLKQMRNPRNLFWNAIP